MSRVERRNENQQQERDEQAPKRDAVDRTPSKAEGDEETVDEALENQDSESARR